MIIMLNFPTLLIDNAFVKLQQRIPKPLGHDAFDSLKQGTDNVVRRGAINSDIFVLHTNKQVGMDYDGEIDYLQNY